MPAALPMAHAAEDTGTDSLVIGGETTAPRPAARPAPRRHQTSPTHMAIATCLGLSVFLLYVFNYQTINISVFWLVCLVLMPLALSPAMLKTSLMRLTLGLVGVQALSLTWSPEPLIGVNDTLGLVAFATLLGLGLRQGGDWPAILRLVRLYCLIGLVQSVLVISLRLAQHFGFDLTSLLLRGDLAKLFFEHNILSLFLGGDGWGVDVNPQQINSMGGIYNIYSHGKSGGLELNGNIAGAWGGLLMFLSLGVFDLKRPLSWLVIAIHAASIIASGSKASFMFLAVVPVVAAGLRFMPPLYMLRAWQIIGGLSLIGLALGLWVLREPLLRLLPDYNGFVTASIKASHCRSLLLSHASQAMSHDWLLGHGYGGWTKTYDRPGAIKDICLAYKLPPHNALILLWTQSGLAGLVCGLGIVGLGMKAMWDLMKTPYGNFAAAAFAAYLFVFLQSLGENLSLFTSLHITAPLAFVIGICAARVEVIKEEARARAMGERRAQARRTHDRGTDERRKG
jgi:hypothetical protein